MAEGCSFESSDERSNNILNEWNIKDLYSFEGCSHLIYDGKRVKWVNNFECLKKFVERAIDKQGKWSSPGGNAKQFTSARDDLVITWYRGKQKTLLFQGQAGDKLRELLIKVCEMKTSPDCTAGVTPEQDILCHDYETCSFASLSSVQKEQFEDGTELPSGVSESIFTIDQDQVRSENATDMEANTSVVIVANEDKPTHNCSKYEIEIAELKIDVTMLWATIHQMQEKLTV